MAEGPDNAATPLGTGPTTVLTAGAAGTWILIRNLTVTNVTGTVRKFSIGRGTSNADTGDAAGLAKRIWDSVDVHPGRPFERGYMVLKGGASPQLLYGFCDQANGVNVTLELWTGP